MKKLLLVFLAVFNFSAAHATETVPADAFLTTSLNEVILTLKNDVDLRHNHDRMETYVSTQILPKFDMALLSKYIVTEQLWESASTEDRASLTEEISIFFRHIFAKTLSEYDNQTISFGDTTTSADGKNVSVKGNLYDPKDETVAFNFRMTQSTSGWKVYDVALGGVDLIYTYRSNFKSILQSGGIPQLITELHKKNQQVASGKN